MRTRNKHGILVVILSVGVTVMLLAFFMHRNAASNEKDSAKISSLPVYNTADFTPVWLTKENDGQEFHTIPAFSFTDQNGNSYGSRELEGKIYAVDFFFTSCPGICPKLTDNFTKVQSAFTNDARVRLVSFSVTPERDSVPVLQNYAAGHGVKYENWRLLTGSKKDIYSLARNSFYADEDLGEQEDENTFLHTENVLLIDTKGRIRGIYKGTYALETEKLIREIKILEEE